MPRTLLLLACHGSTNDPTVNDRLRQHADALRTLNLYDDVAAAFKLGEPRFDSIIDNHQADYVVVLPVTTSEGDFTTAYVPSELSKNKRHHEDRIDFLDPLGVQPAMALIAIGRIEQLRRQYSIDHTQIAIVGHGTKRHARSTASTEVLASKLGESGLPVITGYLDDDPAIETIVARSSAETIIVIPFFIAAGPHATEDVPRRLGLTNAGQLPVDQRVGGHRMIVDRPIGADPAIDVLLATMAREAFERLANSNVMEHHIAHE